jgi:hypothetical protein
LVRGLDCDVNTGELKIISAQVLEGFAAAVDIDWADRKHDICLQAASSNKREFRENGDRPCFPRFTESRSCRKPWSVPVFLSMLAGLGHITEQGYRK